MTDSPTNTYAAASGGTELKMTEEMKKLTKDVEEETENDAIINLLILYAMDLTGTNLRGKSDIETIPKVANAESQSDRSNTDSGLNMHINDTEIKRVVIESLVFAIRKRKEEIISISPARTTETGIPVRSI